MKSITKRSMNAFGCTAKSVASQQRGPLPRRYVATQESSNPP